MSSSGQESIEAIILKKNVFSESNEIVTMYSRELGKVRGVARAIKKLQSKLAFGLQQLFYSRIEIVDRRKRLTIIGAKPLETFKNMRERRQAVHAALYAAELVLKSTADEQPNQELFDYFLKFLKHLDRSEEPEHQCYNFFGWHVLALTGYKVDPKICVVCSRPLNSENPIFFSNRKSGFVCHLCAPKVSDLKKINLKIYQFFAEATENPEDFVAQDHLFSDQQNRADLRSEVQTLASSFIEFILERELKSARYLV